MYQLIRALRPASARFCSLTSRSEDSYFWFTRRLPTTVIIPTVLFIPSYYALTISLLLGPQAQAPESQPDVYTALAFQLSERLPSTCSHEATSGLPGFTYIMLPRQHKLDRLEAHPYRNVRRKDSFERSTVSSWETLACRSTRTTRLSSRGLASRKIKPP